jgi:hypothetical protein
VRERERERESACKRVTGRWRKLHNDELHNSYASPNIRVIKSRKIRYAGHVAYMREIRNS